MQRALFQAKANANTTLPPKVPAENVLEKESVFRSSGEDSSPLFVLLHGAGHTALSWCLVAKLLKEQGFPVLSYDMRGHGATIISSPAEENNFAVDTLSLDTVNVLAAVFPQKMPSIILVGHSMGGSIAAHIASGPHVEDNENWSRVVNAIKGLVVVDVVEGTALEALPRMRKILQNRPESFPSIESAVQWTHRSQLVKNIKSAKISVPPQVQKDEVSGEYKWRTDLLESEEYWEGWFRGLSSKFLSSKGSKMLVLAGTDRLDTELTIAQMQGKYQLVLLPMCGHSIQEDDPETIAEHLVTFKNRYF